MDTKTTKERIFEIAVTMFADRGYKGTSIRDIASAVGIKESSIYNHFKGKGAILQAALDYQIEGFKAASESMDELGDIADAEGDVVQIWLGGVMFFVNRLPPLTSRIARILMNEKFLNADCRKFMTETMFQAQKNLTKFLLDCFIANDLIDECDTDLVAEQYVYMIYGLEVENQMNIMDGMSEQGARERLLKHITHFINGLKRSDGE